MTDAVKTTTSAVEKVLAFVDNTVLVFDASTAPRAVSFVPTEEDTLGNMFDLVASESPTLLHSFEYFVLRARNAYKARFCAAGGRS